MSVNITIALGSDNNLRVGGVTARTDPTVGVAVSTGTVTGRLYDRQKIRKLTADTDGDGASPTLVTVSSAEPFVDSEAIELRLDDGTYHDTTVASKNTDTDVITLAAAVPVGRIAKASTFARRKLGGDISMSLYGVTPAPSVDTWGYVGTVSDTHEGIYLDRKVRCEVDVDDGVNRRHIFSFEAKVVRG